jgi:hypothetical protein
MADDWAAFTAEPTPATPAAAAPAPAAAADDGWAAFTGSDAAAPATTSTPAQTVVSGAPAPTGMMAKLMGPNGVLLSPDETSGIRLGLDRSVRDVTDKPAGWLASAADYLGITHGQGDQVAAQNTADRQAYDTAAEASPTAGVGRIVGQGLLTLPIGGAVGNIAKGAGDVAAATAGRAAPLLETGINRATSFLSGTGGGAGGVASRAEQAGSVIANGAVQGATAGVVNAGQSDAPVAEQALHGAEAGAVAAPIAKGVAAGYGAISGKLSGGEINPEVQRLAQLARNKYGIQLTGDQISPSPFVQNLGSQLRQVPGSGMAPAQAALQSQFTKAVGKTIGEDVDQITPAVMERAATRIGGVMDDVAAQTPAIPADGLVNGLAHVQHDASYLTNEQQQVINKHINNVLDSIGPNDAITGQQYQSLTKFNSPLGKALRSSDSDVRNAAIDIRGHLDDALAQSLPPSSPLAQQLKDARLQYKNLKTIEPLVTKGEPGEISPIALQGQVNRSFKGRGMREQQPDLGEIADIGRQFNLRPDSGTAGRMLGNAALVGVGSATSALMSGNLSNALYPLGAAAGTMAGGRIAGSVLRSPSYINSLLEPAANRVAGVPVLNALAPYGAPAAAIGQGRVRGQLETP